MAQDYATEKKLEATFQNSLTPAGGTSKDTLGSLNLLRSMFRPGDPDHTKITNLMKSEAQDLLLGISSLSRSPELQLRLGTSFEAAALAGQLCKRQRAEAHFKDVLQCAQAPDVGGQGGQGGETCFHRSPL